MNKSPVIVCGGSYMTPAHETHHYAGTHFAEIVAQKLNTDLVVLSNGGCSNFSVALQVEKAIDWYPTPSLILAGNVPVDRIELPLTEDISHVSINDQIYHIPEFKSYHRTKNPKFISTAIRDFFVEDSYHLKNWKNEVHDIEKFIKPIHTWFETCYNINLKRKLDDFVIYSYYHKLHNSKIPYFICHEIPRDTHNQAPWLIDKQGNYLPQYLSIEIEHLIDEDSRSQFGSPYHTSKKCQQLIADLIISTYEKNIDNWR